MSKHINNFEEKKKPNSHFLFDLLIIIATFVILLLPILDLINFIITQVFAFVENNYFLFLIIRNTYMIILGVLSLIIGVIIYGMAFPRLRELIKKYKNKNWDYEFHRFSRFKDLFKKEKISRPAYYTKEKRKLIYYFLSGLIIITIIISISILPILSFINFTNTSFVNFGENHYFLLFIIILWIYSLTIGVIIFMKAFPKSRIS